MTEDKMKFKIPLVDESGQRIKQDSVLGTVGFSESYRGIAADDDSLVAAIRKSLDGQKVSDAERCLIRSFISSFLDRKSPELWAVVNEAVELPRTIRFLEQVGFLERTATAVGTGLANVAIAVAMFDLAWEVGAAIGEETSAAAVSISAISATPLFLPAHVFAKMDSTFGKPGDPVSRSKFDAESVFALVRLCTMRSVVENLELEAAALERLMARLEQMSLALFLANSRQIEGLAIRGSSEASAAVAAHAALALGINGLPDIDLILQHWEQGIANLEDKLRAAEARTTLESVRAILGSDINAIEAQVSHLLASSSATEALDLAVVPLKVSFQLMGVVADALAKVSPDGHFKAAFEAANQGAEFARTTADSTPDALAKTIDFGVSVEVWARNAVSTIWRRRDAEPLPNDQS